ncbi:hypothetical protein CYMTET_18878 [Cymbomonas tetramitiformis]|uniref:CCHC-type domain-containing protein n=1 Tax=Cymbomonas tetramitiformis TaxID=36881 RepID=A0AAE0G762_9CHLO|nr:hypothetical protein CYMTET_18878 [Cymbomonas tetramitiformis]
MSSTPYATPPVLPRRLLTHPPGARKRQLKFGALNGTPTPADAPDTSELSVCNNLAWELLRKPAEFDALLSVIKGKCVEPGESAKTWKFTSNEKNARLLLDILVEQLDSRLRLVHPKMALMFDLQNHSLEVPQKANLLLLETLCAGDALRILRKADRLFPGDGKIALVHLVRHVVPDHEEFSAADFLFAEEKLDADSSLSLLTCFRETRAVHRNAGTKLKSPLTAAFYNDAGVFPRKGGKTGGKGKQRTGKGKGKGKSRVVFDRQTQQFRGECWTCGSKGHRAADCPKLMSAHAFHLDPKLLAEHARTEILAAQFQTAYEESEQALESFCLLHGTPAVVGYQEDSCSDSEGEESSHSASQEHGDSDESDDDGDWDGLSEAQQQEWDRLQQHAEAKFQKFCAQSENVSLSLGRVHFGMFRTGTEQKACDPFPTPPYLLPDIPASAPASAQHDASLDVSQHSAQSTATVVLACCRQYHSSRTQQAPHGSALVDHAPQDRADSSVVSAGLFAVQCDSLSPPVHHTHTVPALTETCSLFAGMTVVQGDGSAVSVSPPASEHRVHTGGTDTATNFNSINLGGRPTEGSLSRSFLQQCPPVPAPVHESLDLASDTHMSDTQAPPPPPRRVGRGGVSIFRCAFMSFALFTCFLASASAEALSAAAPVQGVWYGLTLCQPGGEMGGGQSSTAVSQYSQSVQSVQSVWSGDGGLSDGGLPDGGTGVTSDWSATRQCSSGDGSGYSSGSDWYWQYDSGQHRHYGSPRGSDGSPPDSSAQICLLQALEKRRQRYRAVSALLLTAFLGLVLTCLYQSVYEEFLVEAHFEAGHHLSPISAVCSPVTQTPLYGAMQYVGDTALEMCTWFGLFCAPPSVIFSQDPMIHLYSITGSDTDGIVCDSGATGNITGSRHRITDLDTSRTISFSTVMTGPASRTDGTGTLRLIGRDILTGDIDEYSIPGCHFKHGAKTLLSTRVMLREGFSSPDFISMTYTHLDSGRTYSIIDDGTDYLWAEPESADVGFQAFQGNKKKHRSGDPSDWMWSNSQYSAWATTHGSPTATAELGEPAFDVSMFGDSLPVGEGNNHPALQHYHSQNSIFSVQLTGYYFYANPPFTVSILDRLFTKGNADFPLDPHNTVYFWIVPYMPSHRVWHKTCTMEVLHIWPTGTTGLFSYLGKHTYTSTHPLTPAGSDGGPGRVFIDGTPFPICILYRDRHTPIRVSPPLELHDALGHASMTRILRLYDMPGVDLGRPQCSRAALASLTTCSQWCAVCATTGLKQKPAPSRDRLRTSQQQPARKWASDMTGPISPIGYNGHRYRIHFIDISTGYLFVFTVASKADYYVCLLRFIAYTRSLSYGIDELFLSTSTVSDSEMVLRTDCAPEMADAKCRAAYQQHGIIHQTSSPTIPVSTTEPTEPPRSLVSTGSCGAGPSCSTAPTEPGWDGAWCLAAPPEPEPNFFRLLRSRSLANPHFFALLRSRSLKLSSSAGLRGTNGSCRVFVHVLEWHQACQEARRSDRV